VRKLLLLRPEPGLSASVERARAMGLDVIACPLFRVQPVEWVAPEPAAYDALVLTSANAIRHGGMGLTGLKTLPVHAVGEATAAAARDAGFHVEGVGSTGVTDLLASLPASFKLLHLAGEDRIAPEAAQEIATLVVYRSAPIEMPGLPLLDDLVVAVHSARAGARLSDIADHRASTAIAAISRAAAEACGSGWERVEVADRPDDSRLLALAAMLCHTSLPA
jgi:uroporphyrinogen-III synthase